jgi:hypothetical protein
MVFRIWKYFLVHVMMRNIDSIKIENQSNNYPLLKMKRSTSDSKLDQKKAEKKLQFMGFDLETAWSAVLK